LKPTPATSGRIHELDALRGIAALGVVFWHYGAHFHARPLATVLLPFYSGGFLLVDFFFVLSGFVIARAYMNDRRRWHPLRNIWARISRLYPLHLLTLLVTTALVVTLPPAAANPDFSPSTNDPLHFALNALLLNQVGLQKGFSFNTPAWSISTEFVVNVVFLAVIALAPKARLAAAAVLGAVALLGYAVFHPPLLAGEYAFGFVDVNLLRCALGFAAGVGVFLALEHGGLRRLAAMPRVADVLGILALAATTVLMLATGRHPPVAYYLLSIAAAVGCVAFIPAGRQLRRALCARWLVFLGDVSYSIYLLHFPLQFAVYSLQQHGVIHMDYRSPIVLLAYTATVIALAALTHRRVELAWQSRLLALARRPATPTPRPY
jgi:peptidoglycan/LPS O-acetylase OafA/YrhL